MPGAGVGHVQVRHNAFDHSGTLTPIARRVLDV
jgi:hypothetical protein